uniref:Claspin n=1 Tax=Phallusia mammillata TaxID=59560 RepID=A0A6F9DAC2_9ASCI|nr:claspin [Phallusia mammillata]
MTLLPSDEESLGTDVFKSAKAYNFLQSDESDCEPETIKDTNNLSGNTESSSDSGENENKCQELKQRRRVFVDSDDEEEKTNIVKKSLSEIDEDSDESSSSSESSSDDEDENPPIRIFRNKDAVQRQANHNDDSDDDDGYSGEKHLTDSFSGIHKPRTRSLPNDLEIKSETQRIIRESAVNLPYFIPEAKKLSDFLQRPSISPTMENQPSQVPSLSINKQDKINNLNEDEAKKPTDSDSAELNSQIGDVVSNNTQSTLRSKKQKLLESRGIKLPELHVVKNGSSGTQAENTGFITLTDESENKSETNGVSKFLQRFLKHSTKKSATKPKRVQFTIVQKEDRADGTGSELVNNVVVAQEPVSNLLSEETLLSSCGGNYHKLKDKLNAKMKQRRMQERLKREAINRLDNEEVDESEEELDDGDWSDNESLDDEMELQYEKKENRLPVIDDEESEDLSSSIADVPSESNSHPNFQNPSPVHRSETSLPQLPREGSMLLFDDSIKKLNSSRDEVSEQSFDNLYSSMIPPNQPELSNISDYSKPKLNFDEDSIFNVVHSPNTSASQSRGDGESQFIDSDGFIKEAKSEKSLNFLPPGAEDDNANDCNMSQLLELCSGKFQESSVSEDAAEQNGNESFGFQVEPETVSNKFSDEDLSEESDGEGITIVRKKKQVQAALMKNFLEEEAELSGSDVGTDDEDEENNDFYEEEENDEVLPGEEDIHNQVNKVHLKQLLDEDQRDINLLQEAFVEDAVEMRRKRKFRWKNIDSSLNEDIFSSGDENEECETKPENEESQWRRMRLEREEYLCSQTVDKDELDEDSQLLKHGKTVIASRNILSEVNEDSRSKPTPLLTRSTSLQQAKVAKKCSFLRRNASVLSKFANFKDANYIQGAQNSDKMVFKAVSPRKASKKNKSVERSLQISKKPRLDEDSNSVFDILEF